MSPFDLSSRAVRILRQLPGPILIFGAGGFVGINLLTSILQYRKDVFGVSRDPRGNLRFKIAYIPKQNQVKGDTSDVKTLKRIVTKLKPQTIFDLTSFGSYSWEKDYKSIYLTNFASVIDLIEMLKQPSFKAFVHAGSSSEYGDNVNKPDETFELNPNSHYSVSKIATSFAIKYYGKKEKLPVCNLRLFSVYGPFEDKNRLVMTLINKGRLGEYPPFVDPGISRDFIFSSDVSSAFILAAAKLISSTAAYGESFNIGTGQKTTIKEIAFLVKEVYKLKINPKFSTMTNRRWDHSKDWYADITKVKKYLNWKPTIKLKRGLELTRTWREGTNYYD